jgi:hypothetical protein
MRLSNFKTIILKIIIILVILLFFIYSLTQSQQPTGGTTLPKRRVTFLEPITDVIEETQTPHAVNSTTNTIVPDLPTFPAETLTETELVPTPPTIQQQQQQTQQLDSQRLAKLPNPLEIQQQEQSQQQQAPVIVQQQAPVIVQQQQQTPLATQPQSTPPSQQQLLQPLPATTIPKKKFDELCDPKAGECATGLYCRNSKKKGLIFRGDRAYRCKSAKFVDMDKNCNSNEGIFCKPSYKCYYGTCKPNNFLMNIVPPSLPPQRYKYAGSAEVDA